MVSHRSLLTCSFLIDIITLVPKGMTGYGNSEVESSPEEVLRNFILPPYTSHPPSVQTCIQIHMQMLINSEKNL